MSDIKTGGGSNNSSCRVSNPCESRWTTNQEVRLQTQIGSPGSSKKCFITNGAWAQRCMTPTPMAPATAWSWASSAATCPNNMQSQHQFSNITHPTLLLQEKIQDTFWFSPFLIWFSHFKTCFNVTAKWTTPLQNIIHKKMWKTTSLLHRD